MTTEENQRWELTQVGQKLHWPQIAGWAFGSVCGRSLSPKRTDDHRESFGSPMPHERCKRCLELCPQEALEMANP